MRTTTDVPVSLLNGAGETISTGRVPLLLMARSVIESDQPDVAPFHYSSSLPTGFASIQARSSADGAYPGSSHCANSSSSEYLGWIRG